MRQGHRKAPGTNSPTSVILATISDICADITFIPMRKGFLYLVAILWPAGDCLQSP